ncbi:MAG: pyridoxal phosphate-dependent aminotransferase [Deltaproteobacteria bacterium]|nr:pyridoxal phosphate-dependent aminotransferase [Deltaproteobacteria bacterium]MBZ0219773.1 pyridoxal phosphate-dependent aminotransferase [Deltaproteobacteria bacterium]
MKYDFDRIISRTGTDSVKWDHHQMKGEVEDVIPMSIADMDFEAPDFVIDAVVERARHGVFGYTVVPEGYFSSLSKWLLKRSGWEVRKEWIRPTPGVIPALAFAVQTFTEPGDRIVIQPPVYHPFRAVIADNGRVVVNNPLKCEGNTYSMDIEGFKRVIDGRTKMVIISSPHNPVGRVWLRDELKDLTEVCLENGIIIISDEIHADLVMPGCTHTPTAMLSDEVSSITVTCTSPSKTFNLAELHVANVIIPDKWLYERFDLALSKAGLKRPNVLGMAALEAAYAKGGEWVNELITYLNGNYLFMRDFFREKLPEVKVSAMEGTYLGWLDFRGLGLPEASVDEGLLLKARVDMTPGRIFGPGGEGFYRMNLACPRAVLEKALSRIYGAFRK